jgi:hypothetical protein
LGTDTVLIGGGSPAIVAVSERLRIYSASRLETLG